MRVPDLRVQVDATQIKEALAGVPGIDRVVADFEVGVVDITTAAQDGGANAVRILSESGYPPSEVERVETPDRPG